ncbi:MAG TPA: MlaE family lipid ABC transporter permease subunit [Alphaproteobacteria bacterium]|nr:MlaE family lipid ABC transporter permease subunit [Alphaproteobacteria bacterium]
MQVHTPRIAIFSQKEIIIFKPQGLWVARTAKEIDFLCATLLQKVLPNKVVFDLSELSEFDTTGIWLLHRTFQTLQREGHCVELQNESEAFHNLSSRVDTYQPSPDKTRKKSSVLEEKLVEFGKASVAVARLTRDLIIFLGEVTFTLFSHFLHPKRFRLISIVSHIERFGVNAIPIVAIMSIALGLVLAYQGEEQLRRFGAEIYTINLVSISILREVGILITAILIAGRTGSSITAQIGIMKINQEIDALNTLGLSPMEVLIIPRIIALILVMPLLAFISDIAGLFGGGIMVVFSLNVSPELYIHRIGEAVTVGSFWVGILKAPFFGAIIGIVSCFEGMRVEGTAESVGICTTRSVVEGIFLVTLADALLSVFFSKVGI